MIYSSNFFKTTLLSALLTLFATPAFSVIDGFASILAKSDYDSLVKGAAGNAGDSLRRGISELDIPNIRTGAQISEPAYNNFSTLLKNATSNIEDAISGVKSVEMKNSIASGVFGERLASKLPSYNAVVQSLSSGLNDSNIGAVQKSFLDSGVYGENLRTYVKSYNNFAKTGDIKLDPVQVWDGVFLKLVKDAEAQGAVSRESVEKLADSVDTLANNKLLDPDPNVQVKIRSRIDANDFDFGDLCKSCGGARSVKSLDEVFEELVQGCAG